MSVEKEGWLIKKNERRYFVLIEDTLTWLTHPLGKVKGNIELKNYTVEVVKTGPEAEIVLEPLVKNVSLLKTYSLSSKNPDDLESWAKALEKIIKYRSLKAPTISSIRQGWLEKKGKKRWFLLKGDTLYWFTKQQFSGSDFQKEINGLLELYRCTVSEGPEGKLPKHSSHFNFTIANDHDVYVLTARSQLEQKEWVASIKEGIGKAEKAFSQRREELSMEEQIEKVGYLTKKGKKRFFVLRDCTLYWYDSEKAEKSNGNLKLAGCAIDSVASKRNAIFIKNPFGDSYELLAEKSQDADEWIQLLRQSAQIAQMRKVSLSLVMLSSKLSPPTSPRDFQVENVKTDVNKRGWLMKKGKRRYFILKTEVLVYFGQEQPDVPNFEEAKGHIILKDCIVDRDFHEFSFSLKTGNAKTFTLTAMTKAEVSEWVESILKCIESAKSNNRERSTTFKLNSLSTVKITMQGWAEKKGLQRYFQLQDDTLRWSETPLDVKAKGSLNVSECSVNEVSKDTFMISSPDGKTYSLKVAMESEKNEWMQHLHEAIFLANQSLESGLVLKGWLEKKGKRRWFAVRDGILMWFSTQQTLGSTNSDHASNFVDLKDVYIRVPTGEDPTQFLVEHKTEKKKSYYLKAKTKDEALRWVHLLSQTQTQSACLGKVFGKPLTELELADNGIPIVLDRIVNVLIRIGLKTKGIFRLSGASDVIQRMKDELDKDPRSQAVFVSADEDSIHAYASLLKCFLRELPEPLFTFEFYHRILQTSGKFQVENFKLKSS
eukprot:TRINITY_DN4526_c0_g1_i6.p1 TRINITY_DN4526_c0_g1~~TRINITY_DN4526_c0_g1_i6.p1  ORF type:complete len:770 (+),score=234.79 TRINITY_DN4526_c0_g1_i6:73-2382(+)